MSRGDIESLLVRARIAEDEGELAHAIECLEAVLRHAPNHPVAWAWLGNLHVAREQYAAAEEAFGRALELDPNLPGAYSGLAEVFVSTGRKESAEEALMKSISAKPTTSRYVLLADVRASLGKDMQAKAALEEALRLDPDNEEALLNLALLVRETRPRDALPMLRRAMIIDPLDPIVARELGFVLAQVGELEEAEHYLETSKRLDPSNWWTHLYFAKVVETQDRLAEALAAYEAAVRSAPFSSYALSELGAFHERGGRLTEAEEQYRRAMIADSSDAEAPFMLGRLLLARGERDEGVRLLDQAILLSPAHEGALALRTSLT